MLLSIDEGITGYRDDSLETVKRNRDQYGIPLKVRGHLAALAGASGAPGKTGKPGTSGTPGTPLHLAHT